MLPASSKRSHLQRASAHHHRRTPFLGLVLARVLCLLPAVLLLLIWLTAPPYSAFWRPKPASTKTIHSTLADADAFLAALRKSKHVLPVYNGTSHETPRYCILLHTGMPRRERTLTQTVAWLLASLLEDPDSHKRVRVTIVNTMDEPHLHTEAHGILRELVNVVSLNPDAHASAPPAAATAKQYGAFIDVPRLKPPPHTKQTLDYAATLDVGYHQGCQTILVMDDDVVTARNVLKELDSISDDVRQDWGSCDYSLVKLFNTEAGAGWTWNARDVGMLALLGCAVGSTAAALITQFVLYPLLAESGPEGELVQTLLPVRVTGADLVPPSPAAKQKKRRCPLWLSACLSHVSPPDADRGAAVPQPNLELIVGCLFLYFTLCTVLVLLCLGKQSLYRRQPDGLYPTTANAVAVAEMFPRCHLMRVTGFLRKHRGHQSNSALLSDYAASQNLPVLEYVPHLFQHVDAFAALRHGGSGAMKAGSSFFLGGNVNLTEASTNSRWLTHMRRCYMKSSAQPCFA